MVKLSDFGWAIESTSMRNSRCGTPLYQAPELVKEEPHDEKVDVWAVGILAYELLIGFIPFWIYQESDLQKIVTQEIKFPDYVDVTDTAKDFVLRALDKDPTTRATILQLLLHPFIDLAQGVTESDFEGLER